MGNNSTVFHANIATTERFLRSLDVPKSLGLGGITVPNLRQTVKLKDICTPHIVYVHIFRTDRPSAQ